MKNKVLAILAVGLLAGPMAANASVINLTGSLDYFCTYTASGNCYDEIGGGNVSVTGIVTLDVNPAGPSYTIGSTYAYDFNDWVVSGYSFNWAGGSYTWSPLAGGYAETYAHVVDDVGGDQAYTRGYTYLLDGSRHSYDVAELNRSSFDGTWLSGLAFPENAGLATGSAVRNYSYFQRYSYDAVNCDVSACNPVNFSGFYGSITWTSATVTTTNVPEPGTLALLGLGLAGLGLSRRKKLN